VDAAMLLLQVKAPVVVEVDAADEGAKAQDRLGSV
jgi:hypothetical protein